MRVARILLVDDDGNFLRVLTYHVQQLGFLPLPASGGLAALELMRQQPIDLVITDLRMPEMDGLQLLKEIQDNHPDLPVIVLTAHGSIDKAVEAIKGGAYDFLSKPFEKEEMEHAIRNALKMVDLVEENRRLRQAVTRTFEFGGIVGSSKRFREVLDLAEQLAGVDTTVLLLGESGTGKEIVARAIHYNSPRHNKPFIVVNCGAIPKDLMESELFGYRKGAFTGAATDKKGKFEAADSGTLFLDEVGDLPLQMQIKLLRVLQEREVDVIGEPTPRSVDVRIIAATNQDLHRLMRDGAFREDLYYRLSVAPLQLPPLRERKEDIPLLVHTFVKKFSDKLGREVTFDQAVIELLQTYDWPGNVRELENMVERLSVFDRRGRITSEDLPAQYRHPTKALNKVELRLPEGGFSLEDLERDVLLAALEKHDWNQSRAARYLDITRNTLIYRMQKYNISEGRGRSTAE